MSINEKDCTNFILILNEQNLLDLSVFNRWLDIQGTGQKFKVLHMIEHRYILRFGRNVYHLLPSCSMLKNNMLKYYPEYEILQLLYVLSYTR